MSSDSISDQNSNKMEFDFSSFDSILDVKMPANLKISDVLDYYKTIKKSDQYPQDLKILIDAEYTEFMFIPHDLDEIKEAVEDTLESYTTIKEALVTSKPVSTAIAMLFGEIEINNYEFRAFYTQYAARKWLKE